MKVSNVLALNGGNKLDTCRSLAFDDNYAISRVARFLGHLKRTYGLTDRQAFIAYAFVPAGKGGQRKVDELHRTKFSGKEGSRRGTRYDELISLIRKDYS